MIKIIFADDHEIFRDGLAMLLASLSNIEVVATAKNGKELVELVTIHNPDIVLTDIKMPIMDGVSATKQILATNSNTKVIALTMFDEEQQILDMLEAGAIGYLIKNASKDEIHESILAAYNDINYYCNQTRNKISKLLINKSTSQLKTNKIYNFKEIELEIIKHICNGLTSKEIGNIIHLSFRTIEGYRLKIQEKMEVNNTAGIIRYALKNNLVQL